MDYIKELVNQLVSAPHNEIVIVGDQLPELFISFCATLDDVRICTKQSAIADLKQEPTASILHFGATLKTAKVVPTYFIPLALPDYHPGPSFIQQFFQRKQFNQWLQKAESIICLNDWMYAAVAKQYPNFTSKCTTINAPTLTVPNFEWQHLSLAQAQLTKGKNYFLCFAPQARFVAILKEFSVFKKWQLTTMHLVMVHDTHAQVAASKKQLEGYKFREDISVICMEDFQLEWIAASYAILWEDVHYAANLWVDYAIQYEIPLLFDQEIHFPASWAKLGEVFSFTAPNALSNHFKLYYKDEVYRLASARLGKEWLLKHHQASIQAGRPSLGNILAARAQQ
jgi:hypothetical protein